MGLAGILRTTALLALAAAVQSCAGLPGGPAGREVAFVANAQDATVSLVDVAARRVVKVIDINPAKTVVTRAGTPNFAQDTDVSPDGRTLYVSRGYLGDVAAFDIASGRLLWARSLDTARADHMTITPDGRYLFVSALPDQLVHRIETRTGALAGRFATGVYPHDNQVTADGRRVYNASIGPLGGGALPRSPSAPPAGQGPDRPFQLTIADVSTLQVVDRIVFDNGIRPWRFSNDGEQIYAQVSNQHAVIAYDLAARRERARLQLPIAPGVTPSDWDFEAPHHGLAITPDGGALCLAGRASDYAALVAVPALTLIATIPVGDGPGWSEVADGGRICLLANSRSDDLSFVSIPERKEVQRLPLGDGPKHITVASIPSSVLGD